MQIYLQFLFRARNFSCEFWSVFYVNYAGCYPACCFLFCCLGVFPRYSLSLASTSGGVS